jgi:hypothetical protein
MLKGRNRISAFQILSVSAFDSRDGEAVDGSALRLVRHSLGGGGSLSETGGRIS